MGERNLTLFEYHSHGDGPRILPNLLERDADEDDEERSEPDADDAGRSLRPLIALVVVIAIAAGYRYVRSSDEPPEYDDEQVEVTEYEQ